MNQPLKAVWNDTAIPVHVGQRLLALRTHTSNRTMYLFDYDGERPGWVSGDVIDAAALEPLHDRVYCAIVTEVNPAKKPQARFTVVLSHLDHHFNTADTANALRGMRNWPTSLGTEPSDLKDRFPDLYKVLITLELGAPAQTEKGTAMISKNAITNRLSRTADDNTTAFKSAAYLEAGVIVNRQLAKLAAAKLPLMLRGYADHPVGKLVIANLFKVLVQELRPGNQTLQQLSSASLEAAHLDLIRTLDLDGLIDELLSDEVVKRVMGDARQE